MSIRQFVLHPHPLSLFVSRRPIQRQNKTKVKKCLDPVLRHRHRLKKLQVLKMYVTRMATCIVALMSLPYTCTRGHQRKC